MILLLKQVFDIVDESLSFDYELDLSDYELFDDKPFVTPIHVKGEAANRAGIVLLSYAIDFSIKLHCDRCLEVFDRKFHVDAEQNLVTSLNTDNDEYLIVLDYKLDLDELCLSDILLNLPSKLLCRHDCKGLCQKCGTNLNLETCPCQKNDIDPRLAVLSQLLNNDDE